MPATTLCGEGLSAATLRLLEPVIDPAPYVDRTFQGARWAFPGTTVHVHQTCHTLARERLIPGLADAFEASGGTIEYGCSTTTDQARALLGDHDLVVGADGPGSRVRPLVPGAHVKLRTGLQVRLETDRETPWLEFVTSKRFSREYAWWFPRSGTHNVGLLAEQDGSGKDRARLDAFIQHMGLADGRIVKEEAYPIAFGGTRFGSPDRRVLLVGDAAGLTNPVTKGGIAAILHAAPLLADLVARGRAKAYDATLQRHPLTHPSYQRALRRLRRWSDDRLRRLLAVAPAELHIGGGRTTDPRPIAARALLRRPWLALGARTFYDAARYSARYSW